MAAVSPKSASRLGQFYGISLAAATVYTVGFCPPYAPSDTNRFAVALSLPMC
jgi:hypothetical protein